MREGVLDMLGRSQNRDPRDAAIAAVAAGVDTDHAARVESWRWRCSIRSDTGAGRRRPPHARLGGTPAELGVASRTAGAEARGHVIAGSDIDGFSRQEQTVLAHWCAASARPVARFGIQGCRRAPAHRAQRRAAAPCHPPVPQPRRRTPQPGPERERGQNPACNPACVARRARAGARRSCDRARGSCGSEARTFRPRDGVNGHRQRPFREPRINRP